MRRILKRPRAADDLIELWDYIAEDSVTRADAFIDDVDAKFHLLAEQPMLGRSREELAPGLRSLPFGRYVIFLRSDVRWHRDRSRVAWCAGPRPLI
jgi:toxin ParE1/3/4